MVEIIQEELLEIIHQSHKKDLMLTVEVNLILTKFIGGVVPNGDYDDAREKMGNIKPNSGVMSARPGHARNSSVSVPPSDNGFQSLNRSLREPRRPMPVHERENVFNEWGAVIKHQDEIDRELKRIQNEKLRERQKNYKMQLDMQHQEYLMKKKGAMSELAKKEEDILKVYQKDLQEKQRIEDEK